MAGIFDLARNIRIFGPLAVVVVIANGFFAQKTVDPLAEDILRRDIASEYTRYWQEMSKRGEDSGSKIVRVDASEISFSDISARGFGDEVYFRVQLSRSNLHPPDMPLLRYYRMSFSMVTGWSRMPKKVSSGIGYYTAGLL